MAADKALNDSSDRRQWQKLFNALVQMLQAKQAQLEDFIKERNLIEDRIKIQFDRWVSEVRLLEDQIFQLKKDHSEAIMGRFLEVAKSKMVVGLKQRQSFLYKIKLEDAENDLEDFKLCFDYLNNKFSELKEKSGDKNKELKKGKQGSVGGDINSLESANEEENRCKILEGEIKKLKRTHEKVTSKNNSEVSALLSERNFVWNQFKKMESDSTDLLKNKQREIDQANEKIKVLLTSMEQLQSSNNEKDEIIVKLKAKLVDENNKHVELEQAKEKTEKLLTSVEQLQSSNNEKDAIILKLKANLARLEDGRDKSQKEVSRLAKELESLRSSRSTLGTITPVLNSCRMESSAYSIKSQKKSCSRDRTILKKESPCSQASNVAKNSEKGSSGLRKRGIEVVRVSETPRLFSSAFKVPKLKNSSPRIL